VNQGAPRDIDVSSSAPPRGNNGRVLAGGIAGEVAPVLGQLVELIVEELAPRIADEVATRLALPEAQAQGAAMSELVALDALVDRLPGTKKPETWKRWLYERLRRREVPGAVKLGGNWFLDEPRFRTWLEEPPPKNATL
jgi:hypothetical protein